MLRFLLKLIKTIGRYWKKARLAWQEMAIADGTSEMLLCLDVNKHSNGFHLRVLKFLLPWAEVLVKFGRLASH